MLGYRNYSDQKIIEEIRRGNEQMLVHLYKSNYTLVRNFILKNSGEPEEVDDILQDAIVSLWQNVIKDSFTLTAKLSTYLMAIVKNLWFKELKKKNRLQRIDESQEERYIDHAEYPDAGKISDLSAIHQLLREMDETCRKLLSYFYFDGFNNQVIAEKLGFANTDTVKSKKYQCYKKLELKVKSVYRKEDFFE